MSIRAVLFDLDGTLLPMDQDTFVRAYLGRLTDTMSEHGYDPKLLMEALWQGIGTMVKNDGSRTNEEVFWTVFEARFGPDVRKDVPLFEAFYRSQFQQVQSVCGHDPRAAQAVRLVREKGLRPVLATNPLFPAVATESRIRWAGLDPADFELYTTYENSCRCKPNPGYYLDILQQLELQPEECLMVGNDVAEDMIAQELGMRVFLLTDCLLNRNQADTSAYPQGGFDQLLDYIRDL